METPGRRRSAAAWRPAHWAGAIAWIALTSAGGLFFAFLAFWSTVTLFGDPPTADALRGAGAYAAAAAVLVAAGPFGVWLVRRTRPWLIASVVIVVLGVTAAVALWIRSLGARGVPPPVAYWISSIFSRTA